MNVSKDDFVIRKLNNKQEYLDYFLPNYYNEGFNQPLSNIELYFSNYPEGFYVALLNGELVSIISVLEYENKNAFVGSYITTLKYRGKGYGMKLWNHAVKRLMEKDYTIGLAAVKSEKWHEKYAEYGFKYYYDKPVCIVSVNRINLEKEDENVKLASKEMAEQMKVQFSLNKIERLNLLYIVNKSDKTFKLYKHSI